VLSGDGRIIEIQGTGEKRPFSRDAFEALLALATKGAGELFTLQKAAAAQRSAA
jgi:ribonuclease PH